MSTPLVTPIPSTTAEAAATRVHSPRLLLILRAAWILLAILDVGIFVSGVPDYLHYMRSGCLCDSSYINNKDGHVILLPFANGPLANIVQQGDILVGVDGHELPSPATVDDARKYLDTEEANTPVTLTVRTGDQPPRDITIRRSAGISNIGIWLPIGLSLDGSVAISLLLEIIVFAGFGLVAVWVAWKQSDNWMAFYASAVLISYGVIQTGWYNSSGLGGIFQAGVSILSYLVLFIFPNGQLKPRWSIIILIVNALWTILLNTGLLPFSDTQNSIIGLVLLALGLGIFIYRYRRYFTPLRRQQTKWVLLGIIASTLILQIYGLLYTYLQDSDYPLWRSFSGFGYPISHLSLLFIPITFAFAVFRYHLWDIDLTLNRSLVYGAVTVILLLVIFVGTSALQIIIGNTQSGVAFVISAVGAAILFNPTRRRVQHFVDRRIYHLNFDLNQLAAAQKLPDIEHPGALSGRKLGDFTVLDAIGKGGMGEVYKGQGNGQTVALKILPDDLAGQEQFRQRFEREARTLTALHHPHIVQMIASGESDGVAYMAMEFIDGEELGKKLKSDGALSLDNTLDILRGLASALDYAHEQGFVHRDIKPSNVMLRKSRDGETWDTVLMDFGIAKIREAQSGLTGTGAIGTIDYMAPEQILIASEVDRRADIYALGIMTFEMLTGACPFKGSAAQVMFAHLQQPAPDPRDLNDDLPSPVAHAILRALSKKPDDRFATAGEFAAALQ